MSTTPTRGLTLASPLEGDIDAVVEMMNRYGREIVGERYTTAPILRANWGIPGFVVEQDARLLRSGDGRIVGCASCNNAHSPYVSSYLDVVVDPTAVEDRAAAIELLLDWAEARAEENVSKAPAGARVVRGAAFHEKDRVLEALLRKRGYNRARMIVRMRGDYPTLPEVPALPEGMVYRNLEEFTDLRAVAWADEESFRDHYGHAPSSLDEAHELFEHLFASDGLLERRLCHVVLDGDEVAALCINRRESEELPEAGYVASLGVRPAWRKRGLGLGILLRGIRSLVEAGKETVLLHVDAESLTGANRLYERAGMHRDGAVLIYDQEIRPGEELRRLQ